MNAGTSVDQLERFYLSHADPAMKVGNLQSYKPKRKADCIEDEEEVEIPEPRPSSTFQLSVADSEPEAVC